MIQQTYKRLTAWLLALVMVATMLPTMALATAEDSGTDPPAPAVTETQETPADTGDTGDTGTTGDPGTTGDTGDTGTTGDTGDTGTSGDTGTPGDTGTTGDTGTPGITATGRMAVSQPTMLTGGSDAFGEARLTFTKDSDFTGQVITLKGYQCIKECKVGATVYDVPESERPEYKTTGDYVAYMSGNSLYLKGNLDGACIDLQYVDSPGGVNVFVQDDTTMSGNHCLLYNFRNSIDLHILPGKTLNLNLKRPGAFRYTGAIRTQEGGDVTITGGGTLNINFVGDPTVEKGTPVSGINAGNVTLKYRNFSQFIGSPTVNINMNNGKSGPEGDAVTGIKAGKLTVKDDAKLNIEVTGRNIKNSGESDSGGRVNRAISASSMELLNNASVDIISHKNVVTDIFLTGDGYALTVNTTGHLNIKNHSIVTFTDQSEEWNRRFGYPSSNIYLKEKNATFKLEKAVDGFSIDSNSSVVDTWYTRGTFDLDWYWPVHGNIERGPNMYRGNHRVDQKIELSSNSYLYTWGLAQYIYSPNGVVTVKQSPGLTMDSHAPEGNPHGSPLYYAEVLEPTFNLTYIVRKGESIELTTGDRKGTFLYWYDALRPASSGSGTSWTNTTQTFTNIQQDMVLVPVRDPMKNGPTLSDVGYKEQWDSDLDTNIRYAYRDLTFASADDINTGDGGYSVMLVPAQLPTYGENTYAVKDLKNRPVMGLRSARLYADKKAYGSTDELNNNHYSIPTRDYRIAYYDKDTNRCFISKQFTFDPPVAPPYIDPVAQIFDTNDGGTKTVKITAERGAPIKYSQWDYTKNKWDSLQDYKGPFEVTVTADQDVRIEAYAGPLTLDRRSEVRYALQPTDKPTVKYGETVVSDGNRRYFYDSIELTVEVPEGYEVWYRVSYQPYESSSDGIVGTKVGEDGKVTITDSGNGLIYFKLAKAFTVDGREYRKLSNQETSVHLSKLETLPAPKVTVKTKEGDQTLYPDSSNTYTMTENVVTVTLASNGNWPLNATIAYDTNGNATPRQSKSYTKPFDVRGAGTLSVFTLAPKANGEYNFECAACTFKLDSSLQTVPVSTYNGNCTSYYLDENGNWVSFQANESPLGYSLKVGTKVKIVPNTPSGQVFKKWEIGDSYSTDNIWGTYKDDELYNPELIFYVPKPQTGSYGTLTLRIKATFADAAEANISEVTKVDLVMMNKTVGDSISLNTTTKAMRTISCQWWVGDSAGTEANALPGGAKFDPDKTYTVQVTIKANPGASFAGTAGVEFGNLGRYFTVPNGEITRTGSTLTFTATPVRQIDLTMPAPLTIGDPLPTIEKVGGVPEGVTVQALEWPYTSGNTVPETEYGTVSAALTLKTDGTRPILVGEYPYPTVNGNPSAYKNNTVTNGSTVKLAGIDLPVKAKGVEVRGTVKSYGDANEAVTVTLTPASGTAQVFADIGNSVTYSFDTVPAGTYTLKVEKKGHAPFTKEITVDDSNVTEDVTVYLIGDVNGDGAINGQDLQRLYEHIKGENHLSVEALPLGDVNGDGAVNGQDLQRLYEHVKGEKPLT